MRKAVVMHWNIPEKVVEAANDVLPVSLFVLAAVVLGCYWSKSLTRGVACALVALWAIATTCSTLGFLPQLLFGLAVVVAGYCWNKKRPITGVVCALEVMWFIVEMIWIR